MTKQKTDRSLIGQFNRIGSEKAFAELVRRYQQMVHATALRMCGNDADAQDVTQQVFIVLAKKAAEMTEVQYLGAWLHKVAVLESKKLVSKSARTKKRELSAGVQSELDANGVTLAEKVAPQLDEALENLREQDREVLSLHYLEGRTFKAIADEYGDAAATWQKRSVRALQKLVDQLNRQGVAVSTVILLSVLSAGRAEAGVSAILITKTALQAAPTKVGGSFMSTAIAAKTGVGLSFVAGAALSFTVLSVTRNQMSESEETIIVEPSHSARSITTWSHPQQITSASRPVFSLDMVQLAIDEYDLLEKSDRREASRLKSLMFGVPDGYVEEVAAMLMNVHHEPRFREVVESLFARWAEFAPEIAFQRAQELQKFKYVARKGVMVTWLEMDLEAAVQAMAVKKEGWDRGFLDEYLRHKAELDPEKAAEVVDYVADYWPEVDTHNFRLVADYWSRKDAVAAGEWIASHHDVKVKENLLHHLAGKIGREAGFYGLGLADRIEDSQKRAAARNHAIYWWGVSLSHLSLTSDKVRPSRDLSGGIPEDWTDKNVETFTMAMMENNKHYLPTLLELARSDEQRNVMLEGAVRGASHSDPAALAYVAEKVTESFVLKERGKVAMRGFIRNWYQRDAEAAEAWLSRQPVGPKTTVMWAELGRVQTK